MKVYKYKLEVADCQTISMPIGAKILHVQALFDEVFLWALVSTENDEVEPVSIWIHGTGHPISPDATEYVGTFVLHSGSFIGHVFLVKPTTVDTK